MTGEGNGDKGFEKLRRRILFFGGLLGAFAYAVTTEFLGKEFHVEYLLLFGAMMGISLAQGIDKK